MKKYEPKDVPVPVPAEIRKELYEELIKNYKEAARKNFAIWGICIELGELVIYTCVMCAGFMVAPWTRWDEKLFKYFPELATVPNPGSFKLKDPWSNKEYAEVRIKILEEAKQLVCNYLQNTSQ
jgi:hypothetical protein